MYELRCVRFAQDEVLKFYVISSILETRRRRYINLQLSSFNLLYLILAIGDTSTFLLQPSYFFSELRADAVVDALAAVGREHLCPMDNLVPLFLGESI